jgi:hypothetical protein
MSQKQSSNHVFMIRPVFFRLNDQTAVNNYYQKDNGLDFDETNAMALKEFDDLVLLLRSNGVRVSVFDDTPYPEKPDCLFPNNWISFHEGATTVLYPMFAPNRRWERRLDILHHLQPDGSIIDLSDWENKGKFLEGTGSLVLDRIHRVAYAAISPRTDRQLLEWWSEKMNYDFISFNAFQNTPSGRMPVYHTNVVMSVGTSLAVIGADCIDDPLERSRVLHAVEATGRSILLLSEEQIQHFAGNVLEVISITGDRLFVMSSAAFHSLTDDQIRIYQQHGRIIHSPLQTIETIGGGSARCMLAEVFGEE